MRLVEKMARAICINHGVDPDMEGPGQRHVVDMRGLPTIITDHMGPLWTMWVPDALAALKAMRDPTSPMTMPGINAIEKWDDDYDPKTAMDGRSIACWRAMIDAAIAEAE